MYIILRFTDWYLSGSTHLNQGCLIFEMIKDIFSYFFLLVSVWMEGISQECVLALKLPFQPYFIFLLKRPKERTRFSSLISTKNNTCCEFILAFWDLSQALWLVPICYCIFAWLLCSDYKKQWFLECGWWKAAKISLGDQLEAEAVCFILDLLKQKPQLWGSPFCSQQGLSFWWTLQYQSPTSRNKQS